MTATAGPKSNAPEPTVGTGAPAGSAGQSPIAVSVVVIGRNEGERLVRCLESIRAARWNGLGYELIYVDSRSTDDSVVRATSLGARVEVLTDESPCAAKARNLGWRGARGEFVLFLDGDTELHPDFVTHAAAALAEPKLCAAWGHRRESRPEQSLYTKLLDLDWVYPAGRTLYFGGDVLVRRAALAAVGGFDPSLKAGEEPEMCARLRAAGWEIEHLDVPMTRHDLAVTNFRAWWRRAYRSGIAYAEVAERMRRRGDPMWQHEATRDFRHGLLFVAAPFLLLSLLVWQPVAALVLMVLALALVARTARRCAWKAPNDGLLRWQYAVHVLAQKVPAFFGQLAFRRAQRRNTEIGLIEYKDAGAASDGAQSPATGRGLKRTIVRILVPVAGLWRRVVCDGWLRVWSLARLQDATGMSVDPSNVVLGPIDVQGTGKLSLGRNALIYPGVMLETQGDGCIEIGDGVVLSRGVHIVAFERVTLGDGVMVGEYSSLRDANHRLSTESVRTSGHDSAPIVVGRNVWIGRGVTVLKGVTLADNAVVAANAVVTRDVAAGTIVGGVPAVVIKDNAIASRALPASPRPLVGVVNAIAPIVAVGAGGR